MSWYAWEAEDPQFIDLTIGVDRQVLIRKDDVEEIVCIRDIYTHSDGTKSKRWSVEILRKAGMKSVFIGPLNTQQKNRLLWDIKKVLNNMKEVRETKEVEKFKLPWE